MKFTENYYINEEKGIVVCKLTGCWRGLACDMCKKGFPAHPDFEIVDEFVGKAKCSTDDTFNLEKGKKIAFKRAYAKFVAAKGKALRNFKAENDRVVAELNAAVDKLLSTYDATVERKESEIQYIAEH